MVPIYATCSLFSYIFYHEALYFHVIRGPSIQTSLFKILWATVLILQILSYSDCYEVRCSASERL